MQIILSQIRNFVRAAATAAVGVKDDKRITFGRSADYPRPQLQAKKIL